MRVHIPTICIVLSEHLGNFYAGPLVRGAALAVAGCGARLIIASPLTIEMARPELSLAELPLLPRADLYLVPVHSADHVIEACRRSSSAVLTYSGARPGVPTIGPDNRAGARVATAHLLAHGRRRVVHLAGLPHSDESDERLAGYREALAAAGIAFDERLVRYGRFQVQGAEEAVTQLLRERIAFDAIFAANDLEALGALSILRSHGIRVPADVAVVGFDDMPIAATCAPPLTTVRQSSFQIGWEAVSLLAAGARDGLAARTLVPTQLVVRESCGCDGSGGGLLAWDERLARELTGPQGPPIDLATVVDWVAPLDRALGGAGDLRDVLGELVAAAERRGWHAPALRSYLEARLGAASDARVARALAHLAEQSDTLARHQQAERGNRLNALAYLIDLLRSYAGEQSSEGMLHYLATIGSLAALSVHRSAASGTLSAQRVDARGQVFEWHGSVEAFPPPDWLGPGEVLLLMPLEGPEQQATLVGLIEREGRDYLDLDDLTLRSINTYRSISVLSDTLRELNAARAVQLRLLPHAAPPVPDYDIAGATRPARTVGGDLYGYYIRPSGALAIAVGDVAGKGMPAALLMSACATALAGTIPANLTPSLTLSRVHQMLAPSVGRGQNAAVCLVYLDGGRMRITNAGAVAPLVRSRAGVRVVEIGGVPLGTQLAELAPYHEVEEWLEPGDTLILSSDGIVEAMNGAGELYGFERFTAAIGAAPAESAAALMAHIFADVEAFMGEAEMHDDMAIVVAAYRGHTAE